MTKPAVTRGTYVDLRFMPGLKQFYTPRGMSLADRLWLRCVPEPNSGCWLWVGSADDKGYGTLKYAGVVLRAHRASWMASRGPIPDGLHVCHRCDIPSCINPDHLWLGTDLDNCRDKEMKGRANHTAGDVHWTRAHPERVLRGDSHPARLIPGLHAGERNGRSKLTDEKVREIRTSTLGCQKAARHFGVSKFVILQIRRGKLWKHVT